MARISFTCVNRFPDRDLVFAIQKEGAKLNLAPIEVREGFEPPMRVVSSTTAGNVDAL